MRIVSTLPLAIVVLIIVPRCPAQVPMLHDTVDRFPISVDRQGRDVSPYDYVPLDSQPRVADGDSIMRHFVYPEKARKLGLEGRVYVRFKVDVDGRVREGYVEKGKYKLLNDAAIDAIKKTRFNPAVKNGEPISVWTSETIEFRLK